MRVDVQLNSGRWLSFADVAEARAQDDFGYVFLALYNWDHDLMGSVALSSIESVAYVSEDGDE